VPGVVGVPLIEKVVPEFAAVIPAGRVPALIDQVYGATPPDTLHGFEYATLTSSGPDVELHVIEGDGAIVPLKACVAVCWFASVTLTVYE
jgi:hypothetical protein